MGHHMLRQNIKAPGLQMLPIELPGCNSFNSGAAFKNLKAVTRRQKCTAGFIHAMVGAAYALYQTRGTFWRPHLDYKVYIAPVDTEIESRGTDNGPEAPFRHCCLDLAPPIGIK
jgi:hypothetical protein